MRDPESILIFGKYSGLSITDSQIPIEYLRWMAGRGKYQDPNNRFIDTWKVPITLAIIARREWEHRTGERWVG